MSRDSPACLPSRTRHRRRAASRNGHAFADTSIGRLPLWVTGLNRSRGGCGAVPARAQIIVLLFPAVSSLGGFQTPAAVHVGMFVTAGIWKPSQHLRRQFQPALRTTQLADPPCATAKSAEVGTRLAWRLSGLPCYACDVCRAPRTLCAMGRWLLHRNREPPN